MKVTYAPIVSSASGRFGGMVATTWKGIGLFRRFAAPSNPNTADQQEVRMLFKTLTKAWVTQTTYLRAAWDSFAAGKAFIGRNHWVGLNVPVLKGEVDAANLVGTPGDASTLGPTTLTATPGDTQITCTLTVPTAPTGWTLVGSVGVAILDQDLSTERTFAQLKWTEAVDDVTPYAPVIAGLTNGVLYQVRAFLRWTAPDASTRYSVSLADSATPAA